MVIPIQLGRAVEGRQGQNSVVSQRSDQALGIEDGFGFKHKIDGAGDFDGQDGVGLELTHAGFQALAKGTDEVRVPFGDDGGFAEGPAQIGVAEFGAAQTLDVAGRSDGAFDEATVREEVFDRGEAGDVADLVEDGHGQDGTDAGDGLQEGEIGRGMGLGQLDQVSIQGGDLGVIMADEVQGVLEAELVNWMGFLSQEVFVPAVAVGGRGGGAIMSQLMGLDTSLDLGAIPNEGQALTQEAAEGTLGGGIDVAVRDEVGAEQVREFLGINAVVFVFAAVDGADVEGVDQDEGDAGSLARVGQPIPAEHAFGTDGQVVAVGGEEFEEEVEVVIANVGVDEDFAGPVHEADVHLAGMEINSAVEFGGGSIIFHTIIRCGIARSQVNTIGYAGRWVYTSPPIGPKRYQKTQRAY